MRPLSELPFELASKVELLATDVDGTLTSRGRFSAALLARLEGLARAGIELVPISGRPAGEVLAICRYLPGAQRAVAENGMVALRPDRESRLLVPAFAQEELLRAAQELSELDEAPLRPAPDAFCRMADLAFEREGRDHARLERLRQGAKARGLCLLWSNVHIHLSRAVPDKGRGLLELLGPDCDAHKVAVIGDAPNDGGLFVPGRFGLSVGTAQVRECAAEFEFLPAFVSEKAECEGFCALVDILLAARSRS